MKYTLFSALFLVILFACHKQPETTDPLPPATQEGKNTFGCYINGTPWVAKVEPFVLAPEAHKIEASYDETGYGTFNDNYFRLLGAYYGDSYSSLIIHFKPLLHTGKILVDSLNFYGISFRGSSKEYNLDPKSPFEIEVTKIDTQKNIISGLFYFTGISGADTVVIKNGRFDVRYGQE